MESPLNPSAVPAWMADRLDEHGNRISSLERGHLELYKSQHELRTELRALSERTSENDTKMMAQLKTIGEVLQVVRDRQIEQEATRKAEEMFKRESRENTKTTSDWIRWALPFSLTAILFLISVGLLNKP
jgi:hypothetical protein